MTNKEKNHTNKWGDPYKNEPDCGCEKPNPDLMFFGGFDLPDVKSKGVYCHCKICGGIVWYEKK